MENKTSGDSPINVMPTEVQLGLTKREYFAAMAMQGMIASTDWNTAQFGTPYIDSTAEFSTMLADALIAALNK